MNKVFLGGTCAETTWREYVMDGISVDYFNPVVENWTPACQSIEEDEKNNHCNIHLYVITNEMVGVYSIAEVIDSASKNDKVTIFHVIPDGFEDHQLKSLQACVDMVQRSGGIAYVDKDLFRTVRVINYAFGIG